MRLAIKQALLSGLFEGFFVVLGVGLALFANQWREARASRTRTEMAIAATLGEIASNRAAVAASRDYHKQQMGLVRERRTAGEPLSPRDFPKGFIQPASVMRVAWDGASATDSLEHIELDVWILLGRLYAEQDRYVEQTVRSGTLIFEDMYRNGTQGIVDGSNDLQALIGSFWYTEGNLLERYDETLAAVAARRGEGSLLR